MELLKAKKLVIIAELTILDDIIKTITNLGAQGYTVVLGPTGKGRSGIRAGGHVFGKILANVRIDIVTSEQRAKNIATEVEEKYFKHYAGILYLQDVEVIQARLCE